MVVDSADTGIVRKQTVSPGLVSISSGVHEGGHTVAEPSITIAGMPEQRADNLFVSFLGGHMQGTLPATAVRDTGVGFAAVLNTSSEGPMMDVAIPWVSGEPIRHLFHIPPATELLLLA